MNKELFVSSTPHETRLAITEDGEVVEVYFEREKEYSLAGSIYKGRVTRVLPGMQSAFIDIGLERDAFLYVSDFFEDSDEYERVVSEAESAASKFDAERSGGERRPPRVAAEQIPAEHLTGEPAAPTHGPEQSTPVRADVPTAPSEGAPVTDNTVDDRYGRHRRGRRRGRRRGHFPETKFARPERVDQRDAASNERPADETAGPHTAPPGAAYPLILPGESLAKYRDIQPLASGPAQRAEPPVSAEQPTGRNGYEEEDDYESPAVAAVAEESASTEIVDQPEYETERFQPDSPAPAEAPPDQHTRPSAATEAGWKESEEPAPETEFGQTGAPPRMPAASETEQWDGAVHERDESDFEAEEADEEVEDRAFDQPESEEDNHAGVAQSEPTPAEAQPDSASVREAPPTARFEARSRRRRRRRRGGVTPVPPGQPVPEPAESAGGKAPRLIGDLLRQGQEILVQIAKEPLGKKGARITSHLALPGRYLVYMPTVNHIGVSRKIASDDERARLKRLILENSRDLPGGFIVRTAGQNASEEDFKADIRYLGHLWAELRQGFEKSKAPALLHHDLNLVERTLRDQLSGDFSHIWVDSEEQYQRMVRFVNYFMPNLVSRVRLYTRDEPLFDHFGIQEEINKALRSKVWLKSGGYIVINQTEALVAIDVNTGKYVGKSNRLEDTIFKTNVDAILEIVRQIRLRDLGGIIVIDFIDMDERRNRQKVMQSLEEAMRADRAPSKLLAFNDFGLVALTRKRVKQSLERTLGTTCPYCVGTGLVKSVVTVCNEIYSEMRKIARAIENDNLVLRVNPEVAKALKARGAAMLMELEEMTGKAIAVQTDPLVHQERFEIS